MSWSNCWMLFHNILGCREVYRNFFLAENADIAERFEPQRHKGTKEHRESLSCGELFHHKLQEEFLLAKNADIAERF